MSKTINKEKAERLEMSNELLKKIGKLEQCDNEIRYHEFSGFTYFFGHNCRSVPYSISEKLKKVALSEIQIEKNRLIEEFNNL